MSSPSPAIQDLARRLLAVEAAHVHESDGNPGRAARAAEKLRGPLTKMSGPAAFSSLLARALSLARRRAPSLERLRVQPDGSLVELDEVPRDSSDAGEVLVAEILGLLVTFIGEPLTLNLVREAWPDASVDAAPPSTKDES